MNKRFFKMISCIVILAVFSGTLSSCASFRRKFVRKKKSGRSKEFIPVLDPIEYGPAIVDPLEKYSYYYSLWQVWDKELWQTIERKGSDKRQKSHLSQLILQVDGMAKWADGPKKVKLMKQRLKLVDIQEYYEKPRAMRNPIILKGKLSRHSRAIRNNFRPKDMKEHLVKVQNPNERTD